MIRKTSTFLLVAITLAACGGLSTDLPDLRPISLVTVRSVPDGASPSGFRGKAYAYFFSERGFSFSDSRSATNTCFGPLRIGSSGTAPSKWLDPGQPTNFTLRGTSGVPPRTVQLMKGLTGEPDVNVFTNATNPILYPGTDSAVITIPGAAGGFPALTVTGATVEDFTVEPVADSAAIGGLPVRWSPATRPNTAMEISLAYSGSGSTTEMDTQVVCTLTDDGEFLVPRQYLDGWQAAGDDAQPLAREVRYTRYLTSATFAGDATILLITTLDKKQVK